MCPANDNSPMFHETYAILRQHNMVMDELLARMGVREANIDATLASTQREIERLIGGNDGR